MIMIENREKIKLLDAINFKVYLEKVILSFALTLVVRHVSINCTNQNSSKKSDRNTDQNYSTEFGQIC